MKEDWVVVMIRAPFKGGISTRRQEALGTSRRSPCADTGPYSHKVVLEALGTGC